MALSHHTASEHLSAARPHFWQRLMNRQAPSSCSLAGEPCQPPRPALDAAPELPTPPSFPRQVVVGLPRAPTFSRQQSEQRKHLVPVIPSPDERRAVSADRRSRSWYRRVPSLPKADVRLSAPSLVGTDLQDAPHYDAQPSYHDEYHDRPGTASEAESVTGSSRDSEHMFDHDMPVDAPPSVTTSRHEAMINDELDTTWILNLSMQFRDLSRREKFFVTYREQEHHWRRVTISLDYRDAPPNSLERDLLQMDLLRTGNQRQKIAKIYEAIRESIPDIQFYDTVTNLKLETTNGRLHVHVVQDGQEIIRYPRVSHLRHLGCRRVRESEIFFDSHMSGFVYKVRVHGHVLIKKEIPSQDTIDEFLYEVNALNSLRHTRDVVKFYGVVVDDHDEFVKGLLISYASRGALIDLIFERCKGKRFKIPWTTKERWARQMMQGLADIHEAGFVQGDFTLSNIVIDEAGNAKIIDINRRGCPMGWEPPEATPIVEAGHRITMYIGIKSDLYQLGMVLWALAMEYYEPEACRRPLLLDAKVEVPDWYRQITEICLSTDPRMRLQASTLLDLLPPSIKLDQVISSKEFLSVDDGHSFNQYLVDGLHTGGRLHVKPAVNRDGWPYSGRTYVDSSPERQEQYYQLRGRSPPSGLPSDADGCEATRDPVSQTSWAANRSVRPSYTDVEEPSSLREDASLLGEERSMTQSTAEEGIGFVDTNDGFLCDDNNGAWGHRDLLVPPSDDENLDNIYFPVPTYPSPAAFCLGIPAPSRSEGCTEQYPQASQGFKMGHADTSITKANECSPSDTIGIAPATCQSSLTVAACSTSHAARVEAEAAIENTSRLVLPVKRRREATGKASRDGEQGNATSPMTEPPSKAQSPTQTHGDGRPGHAEDMTAATTAGSTGPPSRQTSLNLVDQKTMSDRPYFQPVYKNSSANEKWPSLMGSEEPLNVEQMPGHLEHKSLAMSLAGIGAAHMGFNDEPMREMAFSMDDEFETIGRPSPMMI
ncbi:hypothetical protein CDD81_1183 [Ophiocordyceps australis]|uniref:Protein kinase domain-containing protein n=1 Tax=Ophiocordyceps australis TaxID=1399860 RepID=A0A2C5YFR9_9HYPO|nr:hypothetical protein CDD81_1183 [Ophiocordyceps australis]